MPPYVSNVRSRPQFSIATLLLLVTTVVATAAWWGANRRFEAAVRENVRLKQELQAYEAASGLLRVVDDTKVHAIGLRSDPGHPFQWKWQLFLPTDRRWQLAILEGEAVQRDLRATESDRQLTDLPSGKFILSAEIVDGGNNSAFTRIVLEMDGQPFYERQLNLVKTVADLVTDVSVGPDDRSVWEPGERSLLLSLRGSQANGATLQIWLWEATSSPGDVAAPDSLRMKTGK